MGFAEIFGIFMKWLIALSLNWWQGLLFIFIIGIFYLIYKLSKEKDFWKFLSRGGKKLSCENCIRILEGKRLTMQEKREKISSNILKTQMNLAEQKLVEILFLFINTFSKEFKDTIDTDEIYTFLVSLKERFKEDETLSYKIKEAIEQMGDDKEIVQKKLYWSIIFEGLEKSVKDEIRRSFKENGFHTMNDEEFNTYLQNRYKIIIALINQQIINLYPKSAGMIITQDQILNQVSKLAFEINMVIREIYDYAKKTKSNADDEIQKIENNFFKEMKDFEMELRR